MPNATARPNLRKSLITLHPLDRAAHVEPWEREMVSLEPPMRPWVKLTVWTLLLLGSLSVWILSILVVLRWVQP